ncbi:MAG TPA: UbiX family flavin prenyltransferase [Polyangiales bacterium]|nr:UbiX family flavin prenyltransferase [Polyangiales bacterium]
MRVVVGISGASGAPYALRLLEVLSAANVSLSVVLSSTAEQVIAQECRGVDVRKLGYPIFEGRDYNAPFASGSSAPDAMVIVPASMSSVAKIAHGISDNLLTRAADVCIKERKKLIMVPREMPYSEVHLTNLLTLTRLGVLVMPASPSFYSQPTTIAQLIDTVIGRVCDHLGLAHQLTRRWGAEEKK